MKAFLIKLTVTPKRSVDDCAGTYYIGKNYNFVSERNKNPLIYTTNKYGFKTKVEADKAYPDMQDFLDEEFDSFWYDFSWKVVECDTSKPCVVQESEVVTHKHRMGSAVITTTESIERDGGNEYVEVE